jgi:hypothetical protein
VWSTEGEIYHTKGDDDGKEVTNFFFYGIFCSLNSLFLNYYFVVILLTENIIKIKVLSILKGIVSSKILFAVMLEF